MNRFNLFLHPTQFLPDVLRREHTVHQPLRPTGNNAASRQQQQLQQPRSPKGSPSRHYGTTQQQQQANTSNELFNDL